ncbi:hypothetical protein L227DRAFT_572307 [Lentinus tigrinus ALCF2SS1-6]|uniref:BTB domain-containing protein n=1 Tax=Lentinus tigrinus ALCF2SS1-6 TaxID=1328759 RepID=A0A5C2SQW2_9APHY|nr:hypothetical protein L227DRAFT_572307 [Lentinus tigrinus ALCF2SS1-6]
MSEPIVLHKKKRSPGKRRVASQHQAGLLALPIASGLAAQAAPVVSRSRDEVQRAALLASVVGQSFEDVKFWAYSRRTSDGAVDTPLSLLANSRLIRKTSSHFGFLLAAGFAESGVADMDAPYPSTRPSFTEMYDYASDSDLDDQEEVEDLPSTGEQSLPVSEAGGPRAPAMDEHSLEEGGKGQQKARLDESESEDHTEKIIAKPGKVVFLEDIAYTTWKAFIVYAYLGEVNFAPLKSENKARPSLTHSHTPPPCSPKSMYRLAEKYDIPDLKKDALKSIQSKLSPHNILEEIFSTFTSLYPAVQSIELEYLHAHSNDSGIRARLPKWLEAMEDGHLPRGAAGIVASLIDKLTTLPQMKQCPSGCNGSISNHCNNCGRSYT